MAKHTKRFTEGMLDEQAILDLLTIQSAMTVLDAGCGSGYMSMRFLDAVGPEGTVHAVDVNPQFVTEVRLETAADNLVVHEADMTQLLPLEDHSVDRVFVSTVLHSLKRDSLVGFVDELMRVVRPGGLLGVVEIDKVATSFGPPLTNRYSPEELCAALPFSPLRSAYVAEYFYMQVFTV